MFPTYDKFYGKYESTRDIPDDVSIIITDIPDNLSLDLNLPEKPVHGQYYKIINISGSKATLTIKSSSSNIYILDENKMSDSISRTTRGTWEFFYVERYYTYDNGSTNLGK